MARKPGLGTRYPGIINDDPYGTLELLDQLKREEEERKRRQELLNERSARAAQDIARNAGRFLEERKAIEQPYDRQRERSTQFGPFEDWRERDAEFGLYPQNFGGNTPAREAGVQANAGKKGLTPYQVYMQAQTASALSAPTAPETRSNDELEQTANALTSRASITERERNRQGLRLLQDPSLMYNSGFTTNLRNLQSTAEKTRREALEADHYAQSVIAQRNEEQYQQFMRLMSNPDFAENSQMDADTAARGWTEVSPSLSRYGAIYNRQQARDRMAAGGAAETESRTAFITDDEAAVYSYIWNTQGAKKANAFYDTYLKSRLDQRQAEESRKQKQTQTRENPVAANAESVALNLGSWLGLVDLSLQYMGRRFGLINRDNPVNYNTRAGRISQNVQTIRDTTTKRIEELHPNANKKILGQSVNLASFLYQTGMSAADSSVGMALNLIGIPQAATLSLMGGAAGMAAIRDARDRGATDGQALLFGWASAVSEAAFEKLSLDMGVATFKAKLDPENFKSIGQAIVESRGGKNGFASWFLTQLIGGSVEGSEEIFTEFANTFADRLVMGDSSKYELTRKALLEQGVSDIEAEKAAAKSWFAQILGEFAGGFLSGFAMSAGTQIGGTAIRAVSNNARAWNAAREITDYQNAQRETPPASPQNAPQNAPQIDPLQVPVQGQQRQLTEREQNPLQFAVNKAQNGETVTGQDAKAILNDPQAVQTLRDAGVLAETIRPGAEGRAQIQQAVMDLAEQTRAEMPEVQQASERTSPQPVQNQQEIVPQERTTPPLPQEAVQSSTEERAMPPVPQETAQERTTVPLPQQAAQITPESVTTPPLPQQTAQNQQEIAQERTTPPVPQQEQRQEAPITPVPQSVQTAQETAQEERANTPPAEARNDEGKKQQTRAQQTVATQRKRAMADSTAVSLQSRGFTEAGAQETAFIREEAQMDAEERAVTEALRAEGLEPTLFTGLVTDADGKKVSILQEGNRVALQADNRSRSLTSLAEQVLGHPIAGQTAGNQAAASQTAAAAPVNSQTAAPAGNQSAPVATGAQTAPTQTAPAAPRSQTAGLRTKENPRAQAARESALQAGASEAAANQAARLAKILNKDIRFVNEPERNGAVKNGWTQDGVIYVNAAVNEHPLAWVVGHELTHNTEHAKTYEKLAALTKRVYGKQWDAAVRQLMDERAEVARRLGDAKVEIDQNETEREIVANFFADNLLTNEDMIREVVENDAPTARRILNYLKDLLRKWQGKEPTIERAIDLYSRALKEIAVGAQEKGAARGGLTVGNPARSAQDVKNRKYSVQSIFNAAGFQVTMKGGRVIATDENGQRITEMTEDMVRRSGIGTMIRYAQEVTKSISKAEAQTQVEGLTRLFNLMLKAQDGDMVWRFAGSAMFSAVKSNSDGQYSTTVDFSTVCKKTEEMMRTMSTVMMRTHKGLTKDQIIELQNDILAENGLVPCPVCYVFSRWAGVGGILDNMAKFQKKYDGAEWDDPARMRARIDQLKAATKTKKALQALLMEEDNAYQQFTGELEANQAEQKTLRAEKKSLTGKKADAAANAARVAEIDKRLKELDGLNALLKADIQAIEKSGAPEAAWLERVRSKPNYREEGYVEEDLLYNLLAADRLAEEKPLAWGYRTSRGPSAGKAILPYSDMRVGDWVLGPKANSAKGANPLFSSVGEQFSKDQAKAIDAAKMKVLAQNLIGGQRYQSTSDFMYDYGLDYLLSFFEGQMLGSKMQTYTKVMEFVNLVASVHGDVNISMMPLDAGYITEADGRQHLIYSSVTGANPEAAIKANHLFDNAQLILVGINDQHIQLALEDSEETGGAEIGFVIPYHASGASINNFIRGLVENLKETFDEKNYKNYEPMQNDSHRKNATATQEARERLRRYLLTGKRGKSELMVMTGNPDGLTDTEMKLLKGRSKDISDRSFEELREIEKRALAGDKAAIKEYESWSAGFLGDLYKKMWTNEKAKDTYGVRLTGDQPDHIMPHEFWDTRVDREHAYINGFRFRSYCYSLGLTPRFTGVNSAGKHLGYGDFSDSKGYWKTLIDRPMYDRSGKYRDQQTMNVTELSGSISEENAGMLSPQYGREFWGENAQTPDTGVAARAAERYLERNAEKPQFSAELTDKAYRSAVDSGDMETAQRMVDEAAERAMPDSKVRDSQGRLKHMYHGTSSYGFTVFDYGKRKFGLFGTGFYFTDNSDVAKGYTEKGKGTTPGTYDVYLNITNPIDMDEPADLEAWEKAFKNSDYDVSYLDGVKSNEDAFRALKEYCQDEGMYKYEAEETIEETLRGMGYDGITHIGGNHYGKQTNENHRVYIALDQEQIKSAEPVTRENGEMIPLSQRFNQEEPDIRYSADLSDSERSTEALEGRLLGSRKLLATPALKKLGVKVSGSVGRYANTEQLMAKNKAAKQLKKAAADAEKRLQATEAEKDFASGIAAMVYDEEDIPARLRRDVVMELADYYFASDSANLDTLAKIRADINAGLRAEAGDLLEEADFKPQSMLMLNERTPERNFRAMFGEKGDEITEWLVQPVRENEAEKIRWLNAQLDKVREFEDSKGKKRELTRQESALTMKYMEGTAAAQMIADLETDPKNRYGKQTAQNIKNAAANIRNGESAADAAREFSLGDREKDLAAKYAAWQNTLQELKDSDSTIVENAAKAYAELFDQYYEAINDFLVAHGYEPIGYIKGYAPHMQPEATQTMLEKALGALGVNAEVKELPASIAGQTANYKPNKRWNPYFLQRTGNTAEYDIVKAFESYVDYMADIFYHTDDIMRARQMVRWIRQTYAPENIKSKLDYIDTIRQAPTEVKTSLLRDAGEIGKTTVMSPMDTEAAMQEYVDKLFEQAKNTSKYSNLVMWLENYANILAGKQSFADRGWEYSTGRKSLNLFNRLNNAFQKSNVAGNLSSVINQTAQLPMIAAELKERDFLGAIMDVVTGKAKGWTQDSDFLTEKEGKDYLYADNADKFVNALFMPARWMDHLVSTVAVRGAFDKAIRQGKSYEQAMRYADDFGRKLMGSRAKGSRPLAYESKGAFSKMIHMFQVECANSWDHIASDLPYEIKQIAKAQGKGMAARTLAALIIRALLGAFLLNRAAEELYGGTPAPFDILGLAANFVASGQGLTTNRWMKKIIDNSMEKLGGERIFGTKATEGSDEFSVTKAGKELLYNVMNDLPLARNVAGVFGLGDQTVPLPGASGEFRDMGTAISKLLKDGVDEGELADLLRATLKAASQFAPGGRQIRKTAEGAEAVIRGGSYKSGKLQYPVKGAADTARALAFGKNATQSARDFWAAGGKALSEKQTGIYQDLVDEGMSQREAYDTITGYRDEGNLDDYVKWTDSRSRDAGIDEGTYLKFREETKGITGDPDGKGGTVSGSKKAKIVGYIDGLDLTPEQKTAMLLDYSSTYSLKDVTWSGGEKATKPAGEELTGKARGYYDGFVAAGIGNDKAEDLARKLESSAASGHEQWRIVYNAAGSEGEKAVASLMTDDMKRNWELAKNAGVSMDDYIKVRENYLDLNKNGKKSQDEWNATLDSFTFSPNAAKDKSIKGTLWQILTGSESTKNNPYDRTAGQKVIDAKKGGGSGSGSYAPARLVTQRTPEAPRAAKPRGGLVATGRPYTAGTGGLVLKKK